MLTVFNLVKGLDVEEALITAGAAALLWASRDSFYVRHQPATLRSALWRIPLLWAGVCLASLVAVSIAAPTDASTDEVFRGTGDLLLWQPPPFAFGDEVGRMPSRRRGDRPARAARLRVPALPAARRSARPARARAAPRRRRARPRARRDTLSFFKLRARQAVPLQPRANARSSATGSRTACSWSPATRSATRTESTSLLRTVVVFAEAARAQARRARRQRRRRARSSSTRGYAPSTSATRRSSTPAVQPRRPRRSGRCASRCRACEKAGYRTELAELGSLDDATLAELEQIATTGAGARRSAASAWRWTRSATRRASRRSSSTRRDADGAIRGFLHFVPTYGRPAVSLSFMRRDPDTPNGLTEFMIVEAIEQLRARGVTEVSLNFAAFARLHPRAARPRSSGRSGASSPSATRGSRSSGSTASTPSSSRAGNRATSCTSVASACREPGSPRSGSRGSCRGRRSAAGAPRCAPDALPGASDVAYLRLLRMRLGNHPRDLCRAQHLGDGGRTGRSGPEQRPCHRVEPAASTAVRT